MTTVFLIRHGQTEANREQRIQGRGLNGPLNEAGRAQAHALAARFAEVPLTGVVASPMRRARETAEALAAPHGLSVALDADWEEMHWGRHEGALPSNELRALFARLHAAWDDGDFAPHPDGGETLLDVQTRARAAWHRVLDAHRDGHVAVVTHGRTLRVLLATLLHADGLRAMHTFRHANTSVNELQVDDDGALVAVRLNCAAHLDPVSA